jgi:hypothetical protein
MPFKVLGLLTICAVFLAFPAWAHHSHGNYDISKWTTLEGTVKELHLVNPHSFLYVDIKNAKGEVETWAMESVGVTQLKSKGVSKETYRKGEPVKVRCHLVRDGGNGCLLGFVTPMHGDPARGHGKEIQC